MNSVENILQYRNLNNAYYSPPLLRKTAATTYDFPEQPPKKDKKWSLGSLFRRKKKEESDSSTEEETDRKGFLNRRRRKSDKKKKAKQRATFDHVIIPTTATSAFNGHNTQDENGILSDPTGGFASYAGRVLARTPNHSRKSGQYLNSPKEFLNHASRSSLGSADSIYKNTRRAQVKIRAQARRETNICASSSDEDSQKSASSSRLRSDESINRIQDASPNRRSRAARTERYIRRISRDEELLPVLRTSKSDAETNLNRLLVSDEKRDVKRTASRSPMLQNTSKIRVISQNSGLSTIPPPSHSNQKKNNIDNLSVKTQKYPPPTTNNTNRYSSLTITEPKDNYPNYQRSVSYDADIHKSASPETQNDVIHANLSLGKPSHRYRNLSLVEQPNNLYYKQPPPPPPRDPWRIGTSTQHGDQTRPLSYCFDRNQRTYLPHDLPNNNNNTKPHSFNRRSNARSTSEDNLPLPSSPIPFHPRPSSATSDHPNQKLYKRNQDPTSDQYQYMADKNPRSRKPIFIQSFGEEDKTESPKPLNFWKDKEKQEKSAESKQSDAQKALDFWKQKEEESRRLGKKSVPSSPQMFTASTHVRTNIFLPSVLKSDIDNDEYKRVSPFKPISSPILPANESQNRNISQDSSNAFTDNGNSMSPAVSERKSSNLEEALDELEAIYNSLRLGDEDLLERAEERERSIAAKKIMEMNSESYPEGWGAGIPRGAMSDSSFSYEPFDSVDSPKRKRLLKKYRHSDRKNDDMAIRKLNKERANTISDPKEVISKVSYLLASPLHGASDDITLNVSRKPQKEPDVTFDDVVFRNIKHANNTLKVCDPQPPFGIPVGPILPACNNDYLHATPDGIPQYTSNNKKIPDVVKDDLAYRNLRKDIGKEPVLLPPITDDFLNNNNFAVGAPKTNFASLKKKRAIRSLSANIYNLIQNEPFVLSFPEEKPQGKPKEKSNLDDIADAMEIARQILKEKEEKINATRKAFLSDTETKYKKHDVGGSRYLEESRMNFLNNMKSKDTDKTDAMRVENYLASKPPRGTTYDKKSSKESSLSPGDTMKTISFDINKDTPSATSNVFLNSDNLDEISNLHPVGNEKLEEPSSPPADLSHICPQKSSLEDLLTAFAVEAQEASRRIANELKQLERNIHFNKSLIEVPAQPAVVDEIKSFDEAKDNQIRDIESVVITEVEQDVAEETVSNCVPLPVSKANIVQTTCDPGPVDNKPIITEIHSDSEHDYVNMGSDAEIEKAIPVIDETVRDSPGCKSPFEEKKAELVADFQEINKVVNNAASVEISTADNTMESNEQDIRGDQGGGEKCVLTCDGALTFAESNKECAFLTRAFINVSDNGSIISSGCGDILTENSATETNEIRYETKLFIDRNPYSVTEYDISKDLCNRASLSESPHSSGFHSNSASDAEANYDNNSNCFRKPLVSSQDNLSGLKSPKLVLDSTLSLENRYSNSSLSTSEMSTDSVHDIPSTSSSCAKSKFRDTQKEESRSKPSDFTDGRHTLSENQHPSTSWCIDPLTLAFACSYGVACTYEYVSMDIIAILGLLFVFVSFIAALML